MVRYILYRHYQILLSREETVTADTYKRVLRYYVLLNLRQYPNSTIFQQDGAHPHFSVSVRTHLKEKLQREWIGRGGPITWSARSVPFYIIKLQVSDIKKIIVEMREHNSKSQALRF